ncbi:non-ribosomal peptide synthetase [Aldersonia kunmingensis]|uniref:non-ribosomal peptide synthetase n=1 Tax=Aldersonia kunmingensis TaxID=408066 RepID=UPI000830E654|nr:non-ribosomal peptide synthetase [Aldersonia kunmingensis]
MTTAATPPAIEDVLALSPLQQGLFTLARMSDGLGDPYVIQFVADIEGPLDIDRLQRGAHEVLRRHPNLRVSFWDKNVPKPVQIVPSTFEIPWEFAEATPDEFEAAADEHRRRPFDLSSGPALRFLLLDTGEGRRRLIGTAHHLIMDGWSVPVFVRELVGAYLSGGSLAEWPAPRLYRDYIVWLAGRDHAESERVWAQHLDGVETPTKLAVTSAQDSVAADPFPQSRELRLGTEDTATLLDWARRNNLTANTLAQFAWAVVLGRLTDRRDLVFGNTISGRPDEIAGIESMVGLFINTIPLRVRLDDRSVLEHCTELQRESSRLRGHGYLGLSAVQKNAGLGELFDTLMVFQNAPRGGGLTGRSGGSASSAPEVVEAPDGVRFIPVHLQSLTHYPLVVVPYLLDDDLVLGVEFRRELLGDLDPELVGQRVLHVLRQLPALADANPDRIDVLLAGERDRIVATSHTPLGQTPPARTVHALFEWHARQNPDRVAIGFHGRTLTYAEVNREANRIAHRLRALGVGTEDTVALALPRTPEFVVAILGIAKAGAVSVPLDVTAPANRIEVMLRRSGARHAVTDAESQALVAGLTTLRVDEPFEAPVENPGIAVHPDQRLYIIFTSGSTGEPKGVMANHRGVVQLLAHHAEHILGPVAAELGRPLRVGHAWSLVFDASWQPTLALLSGHSIELFDADTQRDAHQLVELITSTGVDMLETSPSMFAALAAAGLMYRDENGESRCRLPILGLGGEAIGDATWAQLGRLRDTKVFNFYGPTETSVDAVCAPVGTTGRPAIGRPLAGMIAYVLDSRLRMVPDDTIGELYLAGDQLTRGYVDQPGETAARFVAGQERGGERLYRTGDLVRRRSGDGAIEYHGRADDQVKIRGFRIEPAEVELALADLPGVRTSVAIVVRRANAPVLIGFVVGQDGTAPDVTGMRSALAGRLPAYLIPSRIIALTELPLTPNGKLDQRELAAVAAKALASRGAATAPSTDTERALCKALAALLDGAAPGIDDDFFELGMDSIAAIGLVSGARSAGLRISPRMVMTNTTVRDLAAAIDSAVEEAETVAMYGPLPLLPQARELLRRGGFRRHSLTQLIELPEGVGDDDLGSLLEAVLDNHDLLRAELRSIGDEFELHTRPPGSVPVEQVLRSVEVTGAVGPILAEQASAAIDRIDPARGSMVQAVRYARTDGADLLQLSVHRLAADAVTWPVLLGDFALGWQQLRAGERIRLDREITGYRQWSELVARRADSAEIAGQVEFWSAQSAVQESPFGARPLEPTADVAADVRTRSVTVPAAELLDTAARRGDGQPRDYLLAATGLTVAAWRSERGADPAIGVAVALEHHGRADDVAGEAATDTSRTVGWFSTDFPIRAGAVATPHDPAAVLADVLTRVGALPNGGFDFGLLRNRHELADAPRPQVLLNYLGRFDRADAALFAGGPWSMVTNPALNAALPVAPEPDLPLTYALEVTVAVVSGADGPQVTAGWRWPAALFTDSDIDAIIGAWQRAVAELAKL